MTRGRHLKKLDGKRFGNWEVLGFSYTDGKHPYWKCKCILCGEIYDVRSDNLQRGTSTRCSCCSVGRSGSRRHYGVI